MSCFAWLLLFLYLYSCSVIAAEKEPSILVRSNPRTYRVESVVETRIEKTPPTLLVINMPVPFTNPCQDVFSLKTNIAGKGVLKQTFYPETGLPYISASFQNTPKAELRMAFDVTLYDITADFSKIDEEYPYNKNSTLYAAFTRTSGNIVVPNHPQVKKIAGKLEKESSGFLDYARKSYHYVAEKFKYINPNTGLHPLEKILRDGGGDCGNLSTVFVSLLRCRGVPARHVVGKRPDGSNHVWAEFYMEKYGWIPVDPTFKNSNPRGDFFGKIVVHDPVIILSYGTNLNINGVDNGRAAVKNIPLAQNFSFWYHCAKLDSIVSPTQRFEGKLIETGNRGIR